MDATQAAVAVFYVWVKLTDPSTPAQFPLSGAGYGNCSVPPIGTVCVSLLGRPPPKIVAADAYMGHYRRCRDDITGELRLGHPCEKKDAGASDTDELIGVALGSFSGGERGAWRFVRPLGDLDGARAWIVSAEGLAWRADAHAYTLVKLTLPQMAVDVGELDTTRANVAKPNASPWKVFTGWDPAVHEAAQKARQIISNKDKERLLNDANDSDPEVACQHVRRAMQQGVGERDQIRAEALTVDAMQTVLLEAAREQNVEGDVLLNTQALIQRLYAAVQEPVLHLKLAAARARPQEQCNLTPVIAPTDQLYPHHPAYPSGHATMAAATAHVFGRVLFPKDTARRDALMLAARKVAQHRVAAGLHYVDDSMAGLKLADILTGNDNWFKVSNKEAEAIRAEWGLH